jgi:hypothetical protein
MPVGAAVPVELIVGGIREGLNPRVKDHRVVTLYDPVQSSAVNWAKGDMRNSCIARRTTVLPLKYLRPDLETKIYSLIELPKLH